MSNQRSDLPPIPDKLYFTIGEVSTLCAVKAHVIRYWETEFKPLSPVRRRNRRYYQRKDIELIRRISVLLYGEGYTIDGARQRLLRPDDKPEETPAVEKSASRSDMTAFITELKAVLADLED